METKQEYKIGDCLELLPEIKDNSIDMILCDLPYGTTACKWDTVIPFAPLWKQYYRVLRPNGFIVLTGSQPFTTEMIHSNMDITIKIEHSIQETKEIPVKIKGMKEYEKWLRGVRNNFRIPENISVRTMGTCLKGCCNYPLDGGISHNTLYLTQACFFIENKTPYLKSITLLDGD